MHIIVLNQTKVPPGDKPMFDFVRTYLSPSKTILDIGCGDCSFISHFQINKVNYFGIELNKNKCNSAMWQGYKVLCADIDKIIKLKHKKTFDVVISKDILEHVNNPLKLMQLIHKNLNNSGDLFISVPSELSLLIWDDYTHKRGFSKRAIKELLEHSGFKLVKLGKDHSLINLRTCPVRYIALFIFKKITKMDFITQNYMVHARKKRTY